MTVDFLPWATGAGANVESQAAYVADPNVSVGIQIGLAVSSRSNKTWRQAAWWGAVIANLISTALGISVYDDGNLSAAVTNLLDMITTAAWTNANLTNGSVAVTQAITDSSTKIATTAFVKNYLNNNTVIATFTGITTSQTNQAAHGLGALPLDLYGYLECTTADSGYSIGDCVQIPVNTGVVIWSNATYVGYSTSQGPINCVPKGGGNTVGITIANWEIKIIARNY